MSLFQVYARALRYLGAHRLRVTMVVIANIVLAVITIAEPILFGRIIDAISSQGDVTPILLMWGGFGVFNTLLTCWSRARLTVLPMADVHPF